jgi:predicted dienelactone hydrolase
VAAVTHAGDNYADKSRSVDVMDRPRQISRVIDPMLSSWDGHATIDPAFSADGLKNVKVPTQLWRAENDVLLPHPRYAEAVKLALPEAPDYHVVPNAGHDDFLVPCSTALASIAPAICISAVGFDRAESHASFNPAVVSFFNKTLKTGSGRS